MQFKYDATYEEYSLANVVGSAMGLLVLIGLMPLLVYVLRLHDATIMTAAALVGAAGVTLAALARDFYAYLAIAGLGAVRSCCYPAARALISKMVDKEELGKVYAAMSFVTTATGVPMVFAYRRVPLLVHVNKSKYDRLFDEAGWSTRPSWRCSPPPTSSSRRPSSTARAWSAYTCSTRGSS